WMLWIVLGAVRSSQATAIAIGTLAFSAAIAGLGSALIRELRRRGRAEETALESERRYRLLAEHSFDMIARFDLRTQQATYMSPACLRLYGYKPEEAIVIPAE